MVVTRRDDGVHYFKDQSGLVVTEPQIFTLDDNQYYISREQYNPLRDEWVIMEPLSQKFKSISIARLCLKTGMF